MNISSPKPRSADSACQFPTYPNRGADWLHQFTSLLTRAEVARAIGRDTVLLLIQIAIQEDRQRYTSAPILFDSELMRITGIRSLTHLDRIIRRAEDAGWLIAVYASDDDTVGQYWTRIPERLKIFETVSPLLENTTAHAPTGGTTQPNRVQQNETDRPQLPPDSAQPADVASETNKMQAAPVPNVLTDPLNSGTCHTNSVEPALIPQTITDPSNDPTITTVDLAPVYPARTEVLIPPTTLPAPPQSVTPEPSAVPPAVPQPPSPVSPSISAEIKQEVSRDSAQYAQATGLWKIYPKRGPFDQALPEILRTLEKVPYSVLQPLVKRLDTQIRSGNHRKPIPSITDWFQEQRRQHEDAQGH